MLTFVYFCIVLGLLVCVHEFGHFAAAKLCGVYVHRFSIGFGPALLKWQGKETAYTISCIPLGGFVQMAGQSDMPDEEDDELNKDVPKERFYTSKKVWQRLIIILAGPGMNLIFALPLAVAILCYGQSTAITPNGIVVSEVLAESPAEKAGLLPGDKILSVDGESVSTWSSFVETIRSKIYSDITLKVERDGSELELNAYPEVNEEKGFLGLGFTMLPPAQVERLENSASPLQKGDVVLKIDGRPLSDCSVDGIVGLILNSPNTNITATVANYKARRRADDDSVPEERIVSFPVGEKKKCEHFDIMNIDGRARLVPKSSAPPEFWEFAGAKVLALNAKPLELSQEDYFADIPVGAVTACVAVAAQSGRYKRETVITNVVSTVAYFGHAGIGFKSAGEMVCEPLSEAFAHAPMKAWSKVTETFRTLKLLFTGSLKVNNLSGPVGIARMTGVAAALGFDVLLNFVLLITVNLGVLNLLPLPVLDGGHVVLLIAEGLRGKPLPEKFLIWYQRIGLVFILALFALVMMNDIGRWIRESEFLGTLLGKFFH
ncbi:site-2 protease family protein [bacterium]|jgi:regulator of sigma E protease|nr:site-2 protease family protein [bacterium]